MNHCCIYLQPLPTLPHPPSRGYWGYPTYNSIPIFHVKAPVSIIRVKSVKSHSKCSEKFRGQKQHPLRSKKLWSSHPLTRFVPRESPRRCRWRWHSSPPQHQRKCQRLRVSWFWQEMPGETTNNAWCWVGFTKKHLGSNCLQLMRNWRFLHQFWTF